MTLGRRIGPDARDALARRAALAMEPAMRNFVLRLDGPRPATVADGTPAADVFWEYSTWQPYSVVLVRTRVALH
jgi:hypothetical protein